MTFKKHALILCAIASCASALYCSEQAEAETKRSHSCAQAEAKESRAEKELNDNFVRVCAQGETSQVEHYQLQGASINALRVFPYPALGTGGCAKTPLMFASLFHHKDTIEYLLLAKALPTICDDNGDTALHYLLRDSHSYHPDRRIQALQLLVESGADLHAKNACGQSPIDLAFEYEDVSLLKSLIPLGMHIDHQSRRKQSVFMLACKKRANCFISLLKHNPDLSLEDRSGRTVLCYFWDEPDMQDIINNHRKQIKEHNRQKIVAMCKEALENNNSQNLNDVIAIVSAYCGNDAPYPLSEDYPLP